MEPNKKHKKRRKYDENFKVEVVSMVANGQPASQVAQRLGISESLIYKWKKQTSNEVTKGERKESVAEVLEENARLQKELRRTEMERDILKKAISIVGQMI